MGFSSSWAGESQKPFVFLHFLGDAIFDLSRLIFLLFVNYFLPFFGLGHVLGHITDPYGKVHYWIRSNTAGYIINVNEAPIVYQGDALFHISTAHQ